jgi:hypothetical protein
MEAVPTLVDKNFSLRTALLIGVLQANKKVPVLQVADPEGGFLLHDAAASVHEDRQAVEETDVVAAVEDKR